MRLNKKTTQTKKAQRQVQIAKGKMKVTLPFFIVLRGMLRGRFVLHLMHTRLFAQHKRGN